MTRIRRFLQQPTNTKLGVQMEDSRIRGPQLIILGLCIGLSTIIGALILSQGFLRVIKFAQQNVSVTGSAQKNIRSNYIVWRSSVSRREKDLMIAYKLILQDTKGVQTYFMGQDIKGEETASPQLTTITFYVKDANGYDTSVVDGYQLTQTFEVHSTDVDKIATLANQSTELINHGLSFQSYAPEFYYTNLDELKIEMLDLATKNAKLRADTIVNASGNKLSYLRSAKMGVFQITPATSTEVSDYGYNDTSSLDKKVMAVVAASFAIE